MLLDSGYLAYVPYLYKIPVPLTLLVMPLSYLYIRSTLNNENRFKRTDFIHLLPFAVFTINYLPFYFMPLGEKTVLVNKVIEDISLTVSHQDGMLPEWLSVVVRVASMIFYLILIGFFLKKYYKHNSSSRPHFLKIKNWVYTLFRLQIMYWVGLNIIYFIFGLKLLKITEGDVLFDFMSGTIVSLFFLRIATYLLMNPNLLLGLNYKLAPNITEEVEPLMRSTDFKKIHQYIFHDDFYKDSTLNITQVASHTNMSPRNISIAISDQGFENFKHYVNDLRVSLVKERLTADVLKSYSIEAIATDCGFNSTPTFYRAFKKRYNQTPTDFLKK
ncbi:helix-turn-helix transcriptional regulator [Maribacter antarcticus]|uniref:helix-turn-helix transcriptional regulator n=1 Tax=Maribacter antarcticus TaxID=505250 RepID=UPI00146FC636|nr:helix-turn-helix transcriptional regulator [Maribacter antarcticus]